MKEEGLDRALAFVDAQLAQTDDPVLAANICHAVGSICWREARPDLSIKYYEIAARRLKGSDSAALHFVVLIDLGMVLYDQGRHEAALVQYDLAMQIDPKDNPTTTRSLARRIASLLLDEGRYGEAAHKLGPRPGSDATLSEIFAWTNYRLLLAQRTGQIDQAQLHATAIRDMWEAHGDQPDIRIMAVAMVTALRIDAILRGPAFVAHALRDLAQMDDRELSLNARLQLEILRAQLLVQEDQVDQALAALDAAIDRFIAIQKALPMDLLVAQKNVLDQADRSAEFLQCLRQIGDGAVLADGFPIEQITVENSPFLLALLEIPDLSETHQNLHQRTIKHLLSLLFKGVPIETRWRAFAILSRCLPDQRSCIFLAKMACDLIVATASTALTFASARQRYVDDRLDVFAHAVSLLFAQERLQEGRFIGGAAQNVRRQVMMPLRSNSGQGSMVPFTVAEKTLLALGQTDEVATVSALLTGSVWDNDETDQISPEAVGDVGMPVVRVLRTQEGYLLDITGVAERGSWPVVAQERELTSWTASLLTALEAGASTDTLVRALQQALFGRNMRLLKRVTEIAVQADGVLAAIPFACLFAPEDAINVVYLSCTHAPEKERYQQRRVVLLTGSSDLEGIENEATALTENGVLADEPLSLESLRNVLTTGCDILHISGHFELSIESPEESAFVTASDERLLIRDVWRVMQSVEGGRGIGLVFLSLCESALFDKSNSGGLDLPGLFVDHGAQAVIGAAWKISDFDAARFATAFYQSDVGEVDVKAAFAKAVAQTHFYGFKLFLRHQLAP